MSLDEIKLAALAGDHQVATIDQDGTLLNSCHSVLDLRDSIGEPFFERFAMFVGLHPEVMGLDESDPEICLPKVSAPEFGTDEHLDFRFCFKGEGRPILLLISAHSSVNRHLQDTQQQRNETAIALEHQKGRDASVRAENGSLRSYASELSHDLRAPLRALNHLATWIEEAVLAGDQDKTSEYLGLMRSRTERMTSLVDGLLDAPLTEEGADPPSEVATRKMIHDIVYHDLSDHQVAFQIDTHLPSVAGSHVDLRQVLSTLLNSAVQHAPREGAVVSVNCSVVPSNEGGFHRFAVADNGPGIPLEDESGASVPSGTLLASTNFVDTAVALGPAKQIVQAAGGVLGVESEAAGGVTLWFTWPITPLEDRNTPSSATASPNPAPSHGQA